MTIYADVIRATDEYVQEFGQPDNPGDAIQPPPDGVNDYYEITVRFNWSTRPSPAHIVKWNNGSPIWFDPRTVVGVRSAAIAKTYADVDAVVWDAVGNRTEEYKEAEADARTYKAGSYVGNAPDSIACYALHNPTGVEQTGRWAADDIIARADAFASAKLAMRENRFASQSAMRAATTLAELDAATAAWTSFITGLRTQLGLP